METTAKLEYGPLEVEIHAFDDENYQKEVLDLIQFIEDNQESLEELEGGDEDAKMERPKVEGTSLEEFTENGNEDDEEIEQESGPFSDISSKLRVPEIELERWFYIDSDRDEPPVIYLDEIGNIGERKTDRQRVASLALLYIWHECYEVDRVKSSALKDALELSDISSSGMGNMYQGDGDRYFDRRGRGPSATVGLTPPGRRQARKVLRRFVQDEESD
ncbi:hypothetical protein [Natrialba aegyptia]|uniref:Uncharacterized protein n=1 Tax=Natrialba aegyptia DSM 13077 TaxID=1227491 RepID=M0B0H1_9EURY|nr:hypothetical protein [Natrialba aegyptia]ELZ04406.1 hypothetical protein C480_12866 [Natrialba aegyptia DSM 13077]